MRPTLETTVYNYDLDHSCPKAYITSGHPQPSTLGISFPNLITAHICRDPIRPVDARPARSSLLLALFSHSLSAFAVNPSLFQLQRSSSLFFAPRLSNLDARRLRPLSFSLAIEVVLVVGIPVAIVCASIVDVFAGLI